MTAAVVRRAGDRLEVQRALHAPLSLDPLTDNPELVGREIRNLLEGAGIRERHCVVCVPLKWSLTLHAELPELSDADMDSFLRVRAEREFPFALEDLSLSVSRYHTPDGAEHATIVAVPANHLAVLQKVLNAANLRPAGITLGITSLLEDGRQSGEGVVALLLGENGVELEVATGQRVVALRCLEETVETDPDGEPFDIDMIVTQIRITLGQLPEDLRDSVHKVKVFGPADLTRSVFDELRSSVARMGMSAEIGGCKLEGPAVGSDTTGRMSPTAVAAVAGRLMDRPSELEFLPPRSSRFRAVAGRISSRGTIWLAGVAAVLVLGFGTAFLYQHWRLSRLEYEWSTIEPTVAEIETLQGQIRQFRDWFDESPQSLMLVRTLTEAFPEDGAVWAKMVSIKNLSEVSCSGYARTDQDWETMRDYLREMKGVGSLHVSQIQGDSPLQFALTFSWNSGGSDGT